MQESMEKSPVTMFWGRNEKGEKILRVDKPEINIKAGDTVVLHMPDLNEPVVMIPVKGVFEKQIYTADPGEHTIKMTVRDPLNITNLTFGYAVYSRELKDFAVGNSPPTMVLGDGSP